MMKLKFINVGNSKLSYFKERSQGLHYSFIKKTLKPHRTTTEAITISSILPNLIKYHAAMNGKKLVIS